MIIIHQPPVLSSTIVKLKKEGATIGFVPTMGALHEGHISLIKEAKQKTPKVVCSIFVNPTQFNDPSDYNKYPVRLSEDIRLLASAGTDLLFLPSVNSIYPHGMDNMEKYDLGYLEVILEGQYRPGHFQGVCQVMSRLLKFVQPDYLFMGQKDYQQCLVVKELIKIIGMSLSFEACATRREPDGLAMSSRNLRLSQNDRTIAPLIYQSLLQAKAGIKRRSPDEVELSGHEYLAAHGFRVDYFKVVSAKDLMPANSRKHNEPLIAVTAAFLGDVRLIDNLLLTL